MATQLEQLAKYYQEKGNTPRADIYRALAAEERSKGGPEVVSAPLIPEGAICLPDLTIGGKTPEQLEKALVSGGFKVAIPH